MIKKISPNNIIQNNNNNSLKNCIKYLYITKNDKRYRFSLSKYHEKICTGYYNCYDSACKGRGKIQFDFDNIINLDLYNNTFEDKENFILTKKHTKKYEDHSYKRKEIIKNDLENSLITPEKLKNYEYLKLLLKEYAIKYKNLKFEDIYNKLMEEFPDIKITLNEEEKNK